jgi:hypothetical protein
MIRIARYFENTFADREISDNEIRAFAEDALSRIVAGNVAGIYNTTIAELDTALPGFSGKVATEATAAAIRKARTAATNALMDEIKGKWTRREGRIKDAFGVGSETYLEFYPNGVSEYRDATMTTMGDLLDHYAKAAAAHVAELDQAFADEWSAYETRWATVRGEQVKRKGAVSGAATQSGDARTALELALQRAVLTVALANIGQPERAAQFFNQSLLENPASPAQPVTPPTPPAPQP